MGYSRLTVDEMTHYERLENLETGQRVARVKGEIK